MASPKVVNPSRFVYAKNNIDSKYSNAKKNEFAVSNMKNYMRKKQTVMNMVAYYNGELKGKEFHSYLMEDGHNATDEEANKRQKAYLKAWNNSNVYQTVLSFDNDFIDKNISLEKLNKQLMTKLIPMYLKKIGFQDPKKMLYNASLHLDSKSGHYHYHISFAEKEPNYKSPSAKKYMKPVYRRRGTIDVEDFNFFKRSVTLEVEREGLLRDKRIELNKDIEEIKKKFNIKSENYILFHISDLALEDKIDKLSTLLKEERLTKEKKIKFNSLKNKEIKSLTKEITNDIFNSLLKEEKESFDKHLSEINDYYQKLNNDNNIKEKIISSVESVKKKEYVNNYVYNAIVNGLNTINKKGITREDLLKEIIRKNYPDRIPDKKRNIINHILKKPSKAQIIKGIKSLKDEMEKASQEFSKSFQVTYNYNNNNN